MNYEKYPIRTCRTMHLCCICKNNIMNSQKYYDGGYHRRAHLNCVNKKQGENNDNDNRIE
jgi:hypothetical protein